MTKKDKSQYAEEFAALFAAKMYARKWVSPMREREGLFAACKHQDKLAPVDGELVYAHQVSRTISPISFPYTAHAVDVCVTYVEQAHSEMVWKCSSLVAKAITDSGCRTIRRGDYLESRFRGADHRDGLQAMLADLRAQCGWTGETRFVMDGWTYFNLLPAFKSDDESKAFLYDTPNDAYSERMYHAMPAGELCGVYIQKGSITCMRDAEVPDESVVQFVQGLPKGDEHIHIASVNVRYKTDLYNAPNVINVFLNTRDKLSVVASMALRIRIDHPQNIIAITH